jgi:hypothetical protein
MPSSKAGPFRGQADNPHASVMFAKKGGGSASHRASR